MEKIRIRTLPCGNVRMKRSMSFLDARSLFEFRSGFSSIISPVP